MFDLALIARVLDDAVANNNGALESARDHARDFAVCSVHECETEVAESEAARAEFAKLRKAMEGAVPTVPRAYPVGRAKLVKGEPCTALVVCTESYWGHRVLLVKCDE